MPAWKGRATCTSWCMLEWASGGADGKHGLYEFTQTHMVYIQRT